MARRMLLTCALVVASLPARGQHFASDKRVEVRAAVSLIWIAATDLGLGHSKQASVGALPVELGIGFRLTPETTLAVFGPLAPPVAPAAASH